MTSVWTWGGEYFGKVDNGNLWTHHGKHVGKLNGMDIYDENGQYIGEIRNENRLITKLSKKPRRKSSFSPYANRVGYIPYVNYVGYVMYAGYEDFPAPDSFK